MAITRILEFIKHTVLNAKSQKKEWTVFEAIEAVEKEMNRSCNHKMDVLLPEKQKNNKFVRPRRYEIAAALNRLRSLNVYSDGGSGQKSGGWRVKEEDHGQGMEGMEVEGDNEAFNDMDQEMEDFVNEM